MNASKLRAVLFDLDDTLIDHSNALRSALRGMHANHPQFAGAGIALTEFESEWNRAHCFYYAKFLQGELTHDAQRVARVRRVWQLVFIQLSDTEALAISDEFLRGYADGWKLFEDTLECLASVSNYKLGIITNGWGSQQRAKLDRCGISDRFEAIVISDEAGFSKPDTRIFELACHRLGVQAQQCAFVGDLFEPDVLGAKNAGMRPVWIRRDANASSLREGAIQISTLRELYNVLRQGTSNQNVKY